MANNTGVKIDLHNRVHPKTLAEIVKMMYKSFHMKETLNKEDAALLKYLDT